MANNNHFELTLDTLAPAGSISRGTNQFHNANFALTITKGDATFMYVWFDSSASTSSIPSETTVIPAADSYTTTFSANGNFYYHCVLMDDVGNQSEVYHTAVITYDTVAPTVKSVALVERDGTPTELVKTREIAVQFTASDADPSSGLVSCAVSGDIDIESTAWASALTAEEIATLKAGNAVQRNIVLSGTGAEEANKTVSITVTDAAGNTATAVSDTIKLDTLGLEGHITLKSADESKTITEQWVNVADMKIVLDASNKDDWKGYKVWGDFNDDGGATTTSKPANFTDLTDAEKTAKVVKIAKKWTSGDSDSKKVYAEIIDDAGNVTVIGTNHGTEAAPVRYEFSKVDYTAPSVSIALKDNLDGRIKTHVSAVAGFTTQVFVPTVDATISGAASYQWYMDGTAYTGGSGTGAPSEFTIDSANMGDEGAKVFTLKVVDNAGNETTCTGVTVYVDKTAPTGTITMNAWYGGDAVGEGFHKFSAAGATASATDGPAGATAAGMKYMTCWCSQTATDTTVKGTQISYKANPEHSEINWDDHGETATNYIHIQYVDAVGNAAIAHSAAFGIDTTCDQPGNVAFTKEAYPSTAAAVVNTAPASVSPIAAFKVWGDITVSGTQVATEAAAVWETFANSKSVTLTTGDGTKNINIRYRDTAGNVSVDPAATDSAELDTSKPAITPTLHVSGSEDAKPAISNVKESDLHIEVSDDTIGKVFYQVYGDFTTDGTQAAQGLIYKACTLYAENTAYAADALVLYEGAVYKAKSAITAAENTGWSAISSKMEVNTDYWKEYVVDSGKDYKNVATVCTSGDGFKNFFARAMDNAGNITEQAGTGFEYDTTAPVPTINDVDHNRISKVHTNRLKNESGTITTLTTYNDETKFNTTCDSVFVEYKICAYVSQAAAIAGSHEDAAIPTTAGSVNMSGTGTWGPGQTTIKVDHTIKGADYESALTASFNTSGMTQEQAEEAGFVFVDGEINAIDGAHIVVVYVKDQGGTWSVAANFEV